jgi:hypothetical protein
MKPMRISLIALFCVLPLVAQDVVVQVPITVNAAFRDAVVAWVDAQCSESNDAGNCIAKPYTGAVDLVQKAAQREVDRVIKHIIDWAAASDPSLLPQAMQDAIANRDTATGQIDTLKDGAVQ